MNFHNFLTANMKARVLNALNFLFAILIFVDCCVAFGGVLFTVSVSANQPNPLVSPTLSSSLSPLLLSLSASPLTPTTTSLAATVLGSMSFFWNGVSQYGQFKSYGDYDFSLDNMGQKCSPSGSFFLAAHIFIFFVVLLILIPSILSRIISINIPYLSSNPRKLVLTELISSVWIFFWLFLSVVVFGAQCYGDFESHSTAVFESVKVNTVATGFAYTIVCLVFCLMMVIMMGLVWKDTNCHLGSDNEYQQNLSGNAEGGGVMSTETKYGGEGVAGGYQSEGNENNNL